MFLATWVLAVAVWRFARIEERWDVHVAGASPPPARRDDDLS
jgi:hypothetical protein